MRQLVNSTIIFLLIIGIYIPASYSQNPTFNLTFTNQKQVSNKIFEVDIYLLSTAPTPFELATISLGLTYNNAVKGRGTLKATWVSSSSQLTNLAEQPTILNTATPGVIKIPGKTPPGAGNGSIISNISPGSKIGRLRLTNSTKFTSGQLWNLAWTAGAPYPIAIDAYVSKVNVSLTTNGTYNNLKSEPIQNLDLVSLLSEVRGQNIVLNWSIQTDMNSDRFEIERKVVDSKSSDLTWNTVSTLKATEMGDTTMTYSYLDTKLLSGKYQYRLKIVDKDSSISYSNVVETAIIALPRDFTLSQNYPNPFNPTTKIDYQVPVDAKVVLEVYNIAGQKVAEIVNMDQSAGNYSVDFGSGGKLASGVYVYRMIATEKATGINFSAIRKMMLIK
jgi:hypothetical protein